MLALLGLLVAAAAIPAPVCLEDRYLPGHLCPFPERGRSCTDTGQCGSGVCRATLAVSDTGEVGPPIAGERHSGRCEPHYRRPMGCWAELKEGRVAVAVCR